jgi:hypothetical protein
VARRCEKDPEGEEELESGRVKLGLAEVVGAAFLSADV